LDSSTRGRSGTTILRRCGKLEDEKAYDDPAYAQLEDVLTHHFTTRIVPYPDCFTDCFGDGMLNKKIYVAMQGASEFTLGGALEHWSIVERNATISVPTLVMMGEFDTMTEECSQQVVNSIPTAVPLVTIPHARHCKLIDEPQLCNEAMLKFLHTVESVRRAAAPTDTAEVGVPGECGL
jgi:proline iminopeptidase